MAPRPDGRLTHDLLPTEKGPQDACGVFGVWAPGEEVSKLTYFGLYALQHRGQESAGIATSNGQQLLVFKDMGLVSQVFDETSLAALTGYLAIGHTRYSTTGGSTWENAQPTLGATAAGTVALGHNGNLTNTAELVDLVAERYGAQRRGELARGNTTDTAVITALLAGDPSFVLIGGWLALGVVACRNIRRLPLVLAGLAGAMVLAAVVVIPILLGAIVTVHGAAGFFFTNANGGWEFPAFWAVALAVQALLGDGAYALGALRRQNPVGGLAGNFSR